MQPGCCVNKLQLGAGTLDFPLHLGGSRLVRNVSLFSSNCSFNTLHQTPWFWHCSRICSFLTRVAIHIVDLSEGKLISCNFSENNKKKSEIPSPAPNAGLVGQNGFTQNIPPTVVTEAEIEAVRSVRGRNISHFPLRNPGSTKSITKLVIYTLWGKFAFPMV